MTEHDPVLQQKAEARKYGSDFTATLVELDADTVALFDVTRRHLLFIGPIAELGSAFRSRPIPIPQPRPSKPATRKAATENIAGLLGL